MWPGNTGCILFVSGSPLSIGVCVVGDFNESCKSGYPPSDSVNACWNYQQRDNVFPQTVLPELYLTMMITDSCYAEIGRTVHENTKTRHIIEYPRS